MRNRFMVLVSAVFVLLMLAGQSAVAQGNRDGSEACGHGGWQELRRSDGTEFWTQGDCVRYAAQGGEFEPETAIRLYEMMELAPGMCGYEVHAVNFTVGTWYYLVITGGPAPGSHTI